MTKPRVLIMHATGTNRDREAALACELAGGSAEIVHVNQLRDGSRRLADYQMLLLPGGFSYGDDLGAGRLWASDLSHLLRDQVGPFVEVGRPVMGICNGFQALVKAGFLPGRLPGTEDENGRIHATLTRNASNRFECRWVWLQPEPRSPCVFTRGLQERVYCPVAHGETRPDCSRNNSPVAVSRRVTDCSSTSMDTPGRATSFTAWRSTSLVA